MTELQARLQDVQDGIAGDHAYDGAVCYHRHLIDVFGLHALQDAQRGLVWRCAVGAIEWHHHGLNGSVGPLVARNGARGGQRDEADGAPGAGDDVAAAPGAQNLMHVIIHGDVAFDRGHVLGHDVAGADARERVAHGDLRVAFARGAQQEPADKR